MARALMVFLLVFPVSGARKLGDNSLAVSISNSSKGFDEEKVLKEIAGFEPTTLYVEMMNEVSMMDADTEANMEAVVQKVGLEVIKFVAGSLGPFLGALASIFSAFVPGGDNTAAIIKKLYKAVVQLMNELRTDMQEMSMEQALSTVSWAEGNEDWSEVTEHVYRDFSGVLHKDCWSVWRKPVTEGGQQLRHLSKVSTHSCIKWQLQTGAGAALMTSLHFTMFMIGVHSKTLSLGHKNDEQFAMALRDATTITRIHFNRFYELRANEKRLFYQGPLGKLYADAPVLDETQGGLTCWIGQAGHSSTQQSKCCRQYGHNDTLTGKLICSKPDTECKKGRATTHRQHEEAEEKWLQTCKDNHMKTIREELDTLDQITSKTSFAAIRQYKRNYD